MTTIDIPSLVRPAFFDGQLLAADDLSAIYEFHRELRWLHNRALHAWGIGVGLTATGNKGDRVVRVSPGYALDCEGHDIVLAAAQDISVPPIAGAAWGSGPATWHLTVSYATDGQLAASESRSGSCTGSGAVRRSEAPLLRWQDPYDTTSTDNRFRRGLDIIVATAQIQNCKLAAALSTSDRRDARAATQPYVAGAATDPASTEWAFFPSSGSALGVETTVDTSAAGFQMTPAYVAQIVGSRILKTAVGNQNGQIIDGPASIASASPSAFTLRVTLARNLSSSPYDINPDAAFTSALLDSLQTKLTWSVAWVGVEG